MSASHPSEAEGRTPKICGYCHQPIDGAVMRLNAFLYERLHESCFREVAAANRDETSSPGISEHMLVYYATDVTGFAGDLAREVVALRAARAPAPSDVCSECGHTRAEHNGYGGICKAGGDVCGCAEFRRGPTPAASSDEARDDMETAIAVLRQAGYGPLADRLAAREAGA